jgi:UDP-3-O-[3-hydroxymyristoyl] glucosamine N-acyltransferase
MALIHHAPLFVHRTASVGGPPEHRKVVRRYHEGHWDTYGAPFFAPVLAEGVIVNAFVTIDSGMIRPTTVGARTFIMAHAHLGHDVVVGEDCEIGVGVCISGEVTIGDGVQLGGLVWIKPQVTIGDGARLGGGAVVIRDVPAGEVWAGNPAKALRSGREAARRGQADA